jgi:hypothetical protein
MLQFKAKSPSVEVKGAAILSFLTGMGGFSGMFANILAEHGIAQPNAEAWYRQQSWLSAFETIASKVGPATLKNVGKKIPETAAWPPDVKTIEQALNSIDVAYHMNHRGGEIGHYVCEKIGERSIRIVADTPYPCDFDLGVVEATARKFAPVGVTPTVTHNGAGCRKQGGMKCSYVVNW